MKDTNYMALLDRQMDRESLSEEQQLNILYGLGLELSEKAAAACTSEFAFIPVLATAGWGDYDFDEGVWTPSSRQIFAFDAEVMKIEEMYLNYLKGLQAISEGELSFTNVEQDHSKVCWEVPSGTVLVRFCLNGTQCQYDAVFQGDWLDLNIQDAINHELEKLGIEKRFYATEGLQGNIIFFCTEEWARKFEEATLCFMSESGSLT